MNPHSISLRHLAEERARLALACGALQPIETEHHWVHDHGIDFAVRTVSSLARKECERARPDAPNISHPSGTAPPVHPFNPFLPHDPDLFVADLSESHICLLNKFPVINEHLLIVTRKFEEQETALTHADFQALGIGLVQFESLGFYNGGAAAGASQPHKHLQLVPLPLADSDLTVPILPLIRHACLLNNVGTLLGFPFQHRFALLNSDGSASDCAAKAHAQYQLLLAQLGIPPHGNRQSAPYNLLVTRDWMLLVPRSREHFQGISINALGFAGSLFVKDEVALQSVRANGPMSALQNVTLPPRSPA